MFTYMFYTYYYASEEDVQRGAVQAEDKAGNDAADALAVAGAFENGYREVSQKLRSNLTPHSIATHDGSNFAAPTPQARRGSGAELQLRREQQQQPQPQHKRRHKQQQQQQQE